MNEVIKRIIEICGTQQALADLCGVHQSSISFWLNGSGIKAKYIPLLAKASNGEFSESEILKSLTDN